MKKLKSIGLISSKISMLNKEQSIKGYRSYNGKVTLHFINDISKKRRKSLVKKKPSLLERIKRNIKRVRWQD